MSQGFLNLKPRPPSSPQHNLLLQPGSKCPVCNAEYGTFLIHSRLLDHYENWECNYAQWVMPLIKTHRPIYDLWLKTILDAMKIPLETAPWFFMLGTTVSYLTKMDASYRTHVVKDSAYFATPKPLFGAREHSMTLEKGLIAPERGNPKHLPLAYWGPTWAIYVNHILDSGDLLLRGAPTKEEKEKVKVFLDPFKCLATKPVPILQFLQENVEEREAWVYLYESQPVTPEGIHTLLTHLKGIYDHLKL